MTLTKKELIQRLINGEKLTPKNYNNITYCYYDETYTKPFRFIDILSYNIPMNKSWDETKWKIYIKNTKMVETKK